MRIVAIYLTEHDLFEGDQTINLGGEYLYDISDNGSNAYVCSVLKQLFPKRF